MIVFAFAYIQVMRINSGGAIVNGEHNSGTFSVGNSKFNDHIPQCQMQCSTRISSRDCGIRGLYTEDVVDLFDRPKVNLNHHLYADDQHIYLTTEPGQSEIGCSISLYN